METEVLFKRALDVNGVPIKDGQLVYEADSSKDYSDAYMDLGGKRLAVGAGRSYVNNNFAPVVKETLTGTAVSTDMVSPIEHDVDCRVESKNLFINPVLASNNGVTLSLVDGNLVINGTASSDWYFESDKPFHLKTGKYRLKSSAIYGSGGSSILQIRNIEKTQAYDNNGDKPSVDISVTEDDFYTRIWYKRGFTYNSIPVFAQLTSGQEEVPYTPYIPDLSAVTVTQNPGGKIFKPNAEGVVTGMKSISPSMTITTDNPGAIITAEYNVDTKRFIEAHSGGGGGVNKEYVDQQDAKVLELAVEEMRAGFLPLYNVAGYHNTVFRGGQIGNSVTPEQYATIKSGRFEDMYIGDYWTINGVNWRIAAFDYFLNSGDTPCTEHHVVIVPDTVLYKSVMNDDITTAGAYVGSVMFINGLDKAKNDIKSAFSDHVLKHRVYLNNASYYGKPTNGLWTDSEVSLMTEQMVYGSTYFTTMNLGTNDAPLIYRVEKIQLPLFSMNISLVTANDYYWLRDTVNDSAFADVSVKGTADASDASKKYGVRPYFSIYGGV